MAITWRNISAPNLSGMNTLLGAYDRVGSGFTNFVKQYEDKMKESQGRIVADYANQMQNAANLQQLQQIAGMAQNNTHGFYSNVLEKLGEAQRLREAGILDRKQALGNIRKLGIENYIGEKTKEYKINTARDNATLVGINADVAGKTKQYKINTARDNAAILSDQADVSSKTKQYTIDTAMYGRDTAKQNSLIAELNKKLKDKDYKNYDEKWRLEKKLRQAQAYSARASGVNAYANAANSNDLRKARIKDRANAELMASVSGKIQQEFNQYRDIVEKTGYKMTPEQAQVAMHTITNKYRQELNPSQLSVFNSAFRLPAQQTALTPDLGTPVQGINPLGKALKTKSGGSKANTSPLLNEPYKGGHKDAVKRAIKQQMEKNKNFAKAKLALNINGDALAKKLRDGNNNPLNAKALLDIVKEMDLYDQNIMLESLAQHPEKETVLALARRILDFKQGKY